MLNGARRLAPWMRSSVAERGKYRVVVVMNRCRRRLNGGVLPVGLALISLLAPAEALGQAHAPAPASETFSPQAVAETSIWSTATSDIAPHLRPTLNLVGHYARNPVVLQERETSQTAARLLKDQLKLDVGLGVGLFERVELGFVLPVVLYQTGEEFAGFATPNPVDLADARASIRARILQAGGFGLAAQLTGYLPTSDSAPYQAGPDAAALASLIVDYQGEGAYPWRVAGNVGWAFQAERSATELSTDDRLDFRAAAGVQLIRDVLELRASVFGRWEALAEVDRSVSAGYLGGAQVYWGDTGLASTFGVGGAIAGGYGEPNFRALASLSYAPKSRYIETLDASSSCAPGDTSCSQGAGALAQDNAMIGGLGEDEPAVMIDEGDAVDETRIDSDGDGIPDIHDKCPDEPETINGIDDDDGCPDEGEGAVRLVGDRIEILERVHFDTARASIKSRSHSVLNQVASVLKAHPEIVMLRILGHTDDRGEEDANLALSQQRAASVKEYLMKQGIDGRRLSARGYGETHPIADNATEAGRQANRRVEFHIVERSGVGEQVDK